MPLIAFVASFDVVPSTLLPFMIMNWSPQRRNIEATVPEFDSLSMMSQAIGRTTVSHSIRELSPRLY